MGELKEMAPDVFEDREWESGTEDQSLFSGPSPPKLLVSLTISDRLEK